MKRKLNKEGFTLVEILVAIMIFGMILVISTQLLSLTMDISSISLFGFNNRPKIYENTYYMLNEIQSADTVELIDRGKTLIVNYNDGRRSIEYRVDGDKLYIRDIEPGVVGNEQSTAININGSKSYFEVDGKVVTVRLVIKGLDTGKAQKETIVETKIFIRK